MTIKFYARFYISFVHWELVTGNTFDDAPVAHVSRRVHVCLQGQSSTIGTLCVLLLEFS